MVCMSGYNPDRSCQMVAGAQSFPASSSPTLFLLADDRRPGSGLVICKTKNAPFPNGIVSVGVETGRLLHAIIVMNEILKSA